MSGSQTFTVWTPVPKPNCPNPIYPNLSAQTLMRKSIAQNWVSEPECLDLSAQTLLAESHWLNISTWTLQPETYHKLCLC